MSYYSYLFETKSIQRFLFANGKLKDMVSGSDLIDGLLGKPLDQALAVVGLEASEQNCFRRAGGALYLAVEESERDKLARFRAVWRIVVSRLLPDLGQVDTITNGANAGEALRQGLQDLRAARNRPFPNLPLASPAAARDPRTGGVAVEVEHGESIDASTAAKRAFAGKSGAVVARFMGPDGASERYHWPNSFAEDAHHTVRFPMERRSHVALVHADGNGMGQVLRKLHQVLRDLNSGDYIRMFRYFSDGLAAATSAAAADASADLLAAANDKKVVPARPLVLGGDDLTLLIRDELAIGFAEKFLLAFEQQTEALLRDLVEQAPENTRDALREALPPHLSACAGIVFMKPAQPFAACHTISESLCKRAKNISSSTPNTTAGGNGPGVTPSTIAFHKLKAALMEDADELFKAELQTAGGLRLGLPAYAAKRSENGIPAMNGLRDLARPFEQGHLNAKRLRRLLTVIHQDAALAASEYQRWREVSDRKQINEFDRALETLLGPNVESTLPVAPMQGDGRATPLADLLVYLDTLPGQTPGEQDED
ncbi:MAG: hypothetical protein WD397_06630 [Wenzhouxiangellaceae bacterium]